jgi:hypothetical protein
MEETKTKIKLLIGRIFLGPILLVGFFLFLPLSAQAANLYLSPSSGAYNVGQSFSVNVFVSSADESMNAASGVISFSSDKLQVTSVSQSGSIVNFWVQQPAYSNADGRVSFEGIVLSPGFTGAAGKIMTISFKTKGAGVASVKFSSGSVLANDGQGTNILKSLGTASFNIEIAETGETAAEAETPAVTSGTPLAPRVNSTTHPSSDAWYTNRKPTFSWSLANDITGVRVLVGRIAQANPTVVYTPPINSRTLDELEDGVWYFHVQLRNTSGWGGITHYRFQIDTQKPEYFTIQPEEEKDLTNPIRKLVFTASDAGSGIKNYEIQIDNDEVQTWQDDGTHIYKTPALEPGRHTLIIKALDQAGNFLTSFADLLIEPLTRPTITDYPKELSSKDILEVKGTTYTSSQLELWLQREKADPQMFIVNSNTQGEFTFIPEEKLRDGIYQFWLKVSDQRGASSDFTERITIVVQQPSWWRVGMAMTNVLSVAIPLIALIFLLIIMMLLGRRKVAIIRKRVRKETSEADEVLHKEFSVLKIKLRGYLTMYDRISKRRKLTKEEETIVRRFRKDLDEAEKRVGKEISDIQKQVK